MSGRKFPPDELAARRQVLAVREAQALAARGDDVLSGFVSGVIQWVRANPERAIGLGIGMAVLTAALASRKDGKR